MHSSERECVQGTDRELMQFHQKGEPPSGILPFEGAYLSCTRRERGMCVLCHQKLVQSLFYDIVYASMPCKAVIQKYGDLWTGQRVRKGGELLLLINEFTDN